MRAIGQNIPTVRESTCNTHYWEVESTNEPGVDDNVVAPQTQQIAPRLEREEQTQTKADALFPPQAKNKAAATHTEALD